MTDKNTDQQDSSNAKKGFASMPHEKVQEIGKKGGEASASQAGHEGMAERGRQGGQASGASRRKESEDETSEEDNET